MRKRISWRLLCWLMITFFLSGCGGAAEPAQTAATATVNLVATEVAVQQAAAATLTAVAQGAATPTPVPPTSPAVTAATPTPVVPPTATLVAAPTPTPPLLVLVPVDGGQDPGGPDGQIAIPGLTPEQLRSPRFNEITFKDRIVFQALARVPELGPQDGTGIDNIHFTITYDDNGNQVYEHTEATPGYCIFGGGEPDCTVLFFEQANNRWPDSDIEIVNGYFTTRLDVTTPDNLVETWVWRFRVERYGIFAEIVQTGAGSNDNFVSQALAFQVEAFDTRQGYRDGDGIARVDLAIFAQDPWQQVYQRTEQTAGYCAFSGGEPDCNLFYFDQDNYAWPDGGPPIEAGTYVLRAIVYANDGRTAVVEREIELELN